MTIHTNIIFTQDMNNEYRRKIMDEIEDKISIIVNEYDEEGMYCSGGKGEDVAMGSLITTKDMGIPIHKKIEMALTAAEEYCCGVQRPFRIINTKDEKEIIIK